VIVCLFLAVAILGSPASATPSLSQTLVVDDDGMATPADCDSASATPYTTIQDAIAAATDGDTIVVCPGAYGGGISVDKAVTLQGVGSPGIGCGPNVSPFGMSVNAAATIEGFSFDGGGACDLGIVVNTPGSVTIADNTISGYFDGIQAIVGGGMIGPDNQVFATEFGIHVGGTATIDDNYVGGPSTADILVGGTNVQVTNNQLNGVSLGIGVRVAFGSTGTSITGNTITGHPVGIETDEPSSGTTVHHNTIAGNTQGVLNFTSSGPLDAADNWWGAATGPSNWGIGTGDSTGPNVDFFPWYTDADRTTLRACDGTLASPGSLYGTGASDVLCGSSGDDLISGRGGKDLILGNGGHDHVYGRAGDDSLIGGPGNDDLHGNSGFDSLQGRAGTDKCFVGADGGQTSNC
jgi:hypothetical protein